VGRCNRIRKARKERMRRALKRKEFRNREVSSREIWITRLINHRTKY